METGGQTNCDGSDYPDDHPGNFDRHRDRSRRQRGVLSFSTRDGPAAVGVGKNYAAVQFTDNDPRFRQLDYRSHG